MSCLAFLPLAVFCVIAALGLLVSAHIAITARRRPPPPRQTGFHPVLIQGGKSPLRDAA